MNRLQKTFTQLKAQGRTALIPFMTAGDPDPAVTPLLMQVLVAAGADIIELGVPFSDPMADGPVIQQACERALAKGTSLRQVLDMVTTFRQTDNQTPVVLMGYLNPIEAMGLENFAELAGKAGVDAVLTVDLPPEEAREVVPAYRSRGLDSVFLIAPTTTEDRICAALEFGSGYLYYVSLKGVTGAATLDVKDVESHLSVIRSKTDMPLAVGFGISDADSAARVAGIADGVIVGSALVRIIEKLGSEPPAVLFAAVHDFINGLRKAMDSIK
jgi:tryptophan synthase alpha chain